MAIEGFKNGVAVQSSKMVNSTNNTNLANNSGCGSGSPVLDIVSKKFNWGAFFLSWIWGLGNKSYITLIIFPAVILGIIPILGFVAQIGICVWFGINGNKWAWQNKRWNSIEDFHATQRKWAIAGVIFEVVCTVLCVVALILPLLLSAPQS